MKSLRIFFLTIIVLFLQYPYYFTDYIHTITNGSLGYNVTVNISGFSENLNGILLYCVDNGKNILRIRLTKGKTIRSYIRIQYNDAFTDNFLKNICGVDDHNMWLNISFNINQGNLNASCNNFNQSTDVSGQRHSKNKTIHDPYVPLELVNKTNSIYCMMGNVGPFTDDKNKKTNPNKIQYLGCVENVKFNTTSIDFSNKTPLGDRVKWKCVKQCTKEGLCNSGICIENYIYLRCMCNYTALHGKYCNESLKKYDVTASHSYITLRPDQLIYWKMSWQLLDESAEGMCLLEFENNGVYHMINLDKNVTPLLDGKKANFLTVNVSNNTIRYNISNKIFNYSFDMSANTRINVGFSERDKCKTFEGSYDVHYDTPEYRLYEFPKITTVASNFSDYSNDTSTIISTSNIRSDNKPVSNPLPWYSKKKTIVISVTGLAMINIISMLVCIIVRRGRLKDRVNQITEVIDIDDDDYSMTDNGGYQGVDGLAYDGGYSMGTYKYGSYDQSTSYSMGGYGPQLPPRDEKIIEWTALNDDFPLEVSDIQDSNYNSVKYDRTYICISDDEYGRVRQSVLSTDELSPQLPPRDSDDL